MRNDELAMAASILGDGMRDNPLHVRAFGADGRHREAALGRMFLPVLRQIRDKGRVLAVEGDGRLVGVCAMAPPGRCRLTLRDKLAVIPAIWRGNTLRSTLSVLQWTGAWERRHPRAPHWHLGPIAVRRDQQGRGLGRSLMDAFIAGIGDDAAYLETDQRENVAFYEHFGFAVVSEDAVIGVPNWFMQRAGAPPPSNS